MQELIAYKTENLNFKKLLLPSITVQIMNLRPGSLERRLITKPPFPLLYTIFIFDILNKDEVQHGGKPQFKEIGPYVFE